MADVAKKTWYKSKIILLGITTILVFGSQLLNGWVTGQGVTPEQMQALEIAQPQIVDSVERIQAGENALAVLGTSFGAFVLIFRAWFTSTKIG